MVLWTQYANRRRLIEDDVLRRWLSKKRITSWETFVSWCDANSLKLPQGVERERLVALLSVEKTPPAPPVDAVIESNKSTPLPDGLTVNDEGYVVPKAVAKKKKPTRRSQPRKSSRSKKGAKK